MPTSPVTLFEAIEKVANGTWNLGMAARMTGVPIELLKTRMLMTAVGKEGGTQVLSALARQALARFYSAAALEAALAETAAAMASGAGAAGGLAAATGEFAASGLAAGSGEVIAGGLAAGSGEVVASGLAVGSGEVIAGGGGAAVVQAGALATLGWALFGVAVVVGIGYGVSRLYYRNSPPTTLAARTAPVPIDAQPSVGPPPSAPPAQTCTKSEPFATIRKGNSIAVEETRLTFNDPETGITNTIDWDSPPGTIRLGEKITLTSRSSHFPGGKPMEVQWEFGGSPAYSFGYGASTKTDSDQLRREAEAGKTETQLPYNGGPIRLLGGVNGASADFRFSMQWNYSCH